MPQWHQTNANGLQLLALYISALFCLVRADCTWNLYTKILHLRRVEKNLNNFSIYCQATMTKAATSAEAAAEAAAEATKTVNYRKRDYKADEVWKGAG